MKNMVASCNRLIEFSFRAKEKIKDPFNDIEFSAKFTSPSGKTRIVPGFWDSGNVWRIRYSSDEAGIHTFETSSVPSIKGLSGEKGECKIIKNKNEKNPLYKYGGLTVSNSKITYANGKDFFWLGDTWWMGLCKRLTKDGFKTLTRDRTEKGFTVVQIVAGLYPDMDWYDPRGMGEGGFPYKKDFSTVNPRYFKSADWRIQFLCNSGIVPCVVGSWGYYLKLTGIEKMKKHWRYIVARWGAYPCVWCIAGETIMPYYLSETRQQDMDFQKKGWTEVVEYVKNIDPFSRPITTHPTNLGHEQIENPELLDINMLQTGHGSHTSFEHTWASIDKAKKACPEKPIIIGEVNYEGIGEACRQEIQRICFWGSMLSGASGFTYGANGIWQINTEQKPYGPSPHGRSWGDTPWEQAYKLPGSLHLSIGKQILFRMNWQKLVPCREKLVVEDEKSCIFAAEIPDQIMIIYVGPPAFSSGFKEISGLKQNCAYELSFIDPKDGRIKKKMKLQSDKNGRVSLEQHFWRMVPIWQDWLLTVKEKQ
ncbi:MAG TPA: DUF4038 domain-containing protein [bacterium]|nr:DUF4038 domain-containing protein [bacterium]